MDTRKTADDPRDKRQARAQGAVAHGLASGRRPAPAVAALDSGARPSAWRVEARSETGPRDYQQDAFAWQQITCSGGSARLCCVLADGMGGLAGGGLASGLAARVLLERLQPHILLAGDEQWQDASFCEAALRSAFSYARAVLKEVAAAEPALADMGTTAAVTIHTGSQVIVAWSGDSRVYAFGEGLELLTRDHSAAWALVESGKVSASELRHVGTRSILTSYLGTDCDDVEVICRSDGPGKAYLLATDGVWELFDEGELEGLLRPLTRPSQSADLGVLADSLLAEVVRRGPADNATFMLVAAQRPAQGRTGAYPCLRRLPAFVPAFREEVDDDGKGT